MQPVIMTLVFSIVLLLFMIFPAIKIVEFLKTKTKIEISDKTFDILTVVLTIVLALISGTLINFI